MLKKEFFFSNTAGLYPATFPKMNSFTSIFQRFCKTLRKPIWLSVAASEYRLSLIYLLVSFIAISPWTFYCDNQIVELIVECLSKERCFHRNKYLDMHWDLWQWCLWQHRYHLSVKLRSIQKVLFFTRFFTY